MGLFYLPQPRLNRETHLLHPTGFVHGHFPPTKEIQMIRTTYLLGGMLTAMAVWLVYRGQQPKEVEILAHRLEEAWADHHTRV
jgi:hypothetical protein